MKKAAEHKPDIFDVLKVAFGAATQVLVDLYLSFSQANMIN